MSRIAYVNGQYVSHRDATVHVEDRGYQFADGVYEVFAVMGGKLIGEQGHLERLAHSLSELRIEWPMSRPALMVAVKEIVRRNHVRDGLVYLQVTRGVSPRDHPFPQHSDSALVITARKSGPLDKDTLRNGVDIITIPDIRWQRCDIKSVALLANVLGKQEAREANAFEAWQVDEDGYITEGTSTNAWIVTASGELVTRNVSTSILNGVTRLAVLEAAVEVGVDIIERPFTTLEALAAREAFITSSTSHVKAVTRINGQSIGNGYVGDLTNRGLDAYVEYVETNGGPQTTDKWN
ncbi:MAG: D-amino acid aminotransferase [Magnetovibrio sp.]|nr:D-amino acid aminotransferase [Magnetovibrio sp.]